MSSEIKFPTEAEQAAWWAGYEAGEKSATVERGALRETLTWIADPSYVGNYADDPAQVVEIHRKWAKNALERPE